MTAARLQRYALFLAGFNYKIEYKNTKLHGNADGLSRLPLEIEKEEEETVDPVGLFYATQFDPLPVTAEKVKRETQRDPTLLRVYELTMKGWPIELDPDLKAFHSHRNELTVHCGCLMLGNRVVIPAKLRSQVLEELHQGHIGVVKMKGLERSYIWWPGIDKDVEGLAKSCTGCQMVQTQPRTAPLHPWEWPSAPWERIHVDFAGPFLGSMFLIVVDAHSKWPEVEVMRSTTTSQTVERLQALFARYGVPAQLVSDNGPQFTSEEFQLFMKRNGIKHITSAPYHPATNGLAERFVQSFKQAMKSEREMTSLKVTMAKFLLAYRNTAHATTGETPAVLFMGRQLRTRLDLLKPSLHSKIVESQRKQAVAKGGLLRQLAVGQKVVARNYMGQNKWAPGIVRAQTGPLSYKVEVGSKLVWRRHIDQLRDSEIKLDSQVRTSAELPSQLPVLTEDASSSEAETPHQVPCTVDPVPVSAENPASTKDGPANPAVPAENTCSTRWYPTRDRHPPLKFAE